MSPKPKIGIDWPPAHEGKTTIPNKEAFAAVAENCGTTGSGTDNDIQSCSGHGCEKVASRLLKEKNWRFGYIEHVKEVFELIAQDKTGNGCKKGLQNLYDNFVFRYADNSTKTLTEYSKTPVQKGDVLTETSTTKGCYFKAKVIDARSVSPQSDSNKDVIQHTITATKQLYIPYKQKDHHGEKHIKHLLQRWADYGTCEPDVVDKISAVLPLLPMSGSNPWKNKVVVILGAGSELGPLKQLLKWGATVIAVRTRKPIEWEKMIDYCKNETCGRLIIPVNNNAGEQMGCDIMAEANEIRDWVINVVEGLDGTENNYINDITMGMYTYLDGEAHVRVSLGCDMIQSGVSEYFKNDSNLKKRKVRYAYLGSCGATFAVSKECYHAIDQYRADAPFLARMTFASEPVRSKLPNGVHLVHPFITVQGPNYALAKSLQIWRATVIQAENKDFVSHNIAPACRTDSVVGGGGAIKHFVNGMPLLPPLETLDAPTGSMIMSFLLCYDILIRDSDDPPAANGGAKDHIHQPIECTRYGNFHGGLGRVGYDTNSSKALSALIYGYGRIMGDEAGGLEA